MTVPLLIGAAALFVCANLQAAPGDLDTTFNVTGIVTTSISTGNDYGQSVVLQPDGKIVMVGGASDSASFAVVRYNTNGTVDTSFGNGTGFVTTAGATASFPAIRAYANAIALQTDGKIVAAGESYYGNPANGIVDIALMVVRYNADGSLDSTFNYGSGIVNIPFGNLHNAAAVAVAVQDDGKIVLAGFEQASSASGNNWVVLRCNADGSLDTTFNVSGNRPGIIDTSLRGVSDVAWGLVLQSDRKIVVVGYSQTDYGDVAVLRYNPDGTLDTSFGVSGNGAVFTDWGRQSQADSVQLQSDGKIVVAGFAGYFYGNADFALARYNTDGSLDSNFNINGSGIVLTTPGVSFGDFIGLAIQSDGKILESGVANNGSKNVFEVLRYNVDGSLDTSFGNGTGFVTTPVGNGDSIAQGLALQSNGNILVSGYTYDGIKNDFALVRYQGGNLNPLVLSAPATIYQNATSPAGAVVNFSVTATDSLDPNPTITCSPASGSIFPVGTNQVTCTASDAYGNSASAGFDVVVVGASQQITALVSLVATFNLAQGIDNSLDAKLQNAQAALTAAKSGSNPSACNMLGAFINSVQAQSGNKITTSQAGQLIAAANQIQAAVGCP